MQIESTHISHPGVGASGPTVTVPSMAVGLLKPAPWNPRKMFNQTALHELAADITARGILQPLVVRDLGTHHEIVCGERRWRAAQFAGLEAVPVTVRELSDREALECAISENGKRDSLHPLEEADAYLALRDTHGESPEDIAARFGVSPVLVHQRLSLASLCAEGRDAFITGKIALGQARKIARLPTAYQVETLKWVTERPEWQGAATTEDVGRWIQQRYHLNLRIAPFDPTDATILPEAGACDACPKNTDSQQALFDDVPRGQCTDPVCFARKKEAAWQQVAAKAAAPGQTVLTYEVSAGIAPSWHGGPWSKGYASPDEKPHDYGGRKTWRQLLGVNMPALVIARDTTGAAVEIIQPDDLKAAVKKAALKKLVKDGGASGGSSSSGSKKARDGIDDVSDYKKRIDLREEHFKAVFADAQKALTTKKPAIDGAEVWRTIARAISATVYDGANVAMASRWTGRGEPPTGASATAALDKLIASMTARQCFDLVIEMLLGGLVDESDCGAAEIVCDWLGVDVKAVEKRVLEAAFPPKPVKGAAPAAKKSTTKKPAAKKPAAKTGKRW